LYRASTDGNNRIGAVCGNRIQKIYIYTHD
jgi:hypothetical protein